MMTTIQVTLDGRILVLRGRNIIELAEPGETRAIIATLAEALAQQIAMVGDDAPQSAALAGA